MSRVCRDTSFVATSILFSRPKTCFAATKRVFVATKMILVAAPAKDTIWCTLRTDELQCESQLVSPSYRLQDEDRKQSKEALIESEEKPGLKPSLSPPSYAHSTQEWGFWQQQRVV